MQLHNIAHEKTVMTTAITRELKNAVTNYCGIANNYMPSLQSTLSPIEKSGKRLAKKAQANPKELYTLQVLQLVLNVQISPTT